eukprot:1184538-Amphidinium_carterae.1
MAAVFSVSRALWRQTKEQCVKQSSMEAERTQHGLLILVALTAYTSLDHLITMPIVGHVAMYVDDLLLCRLRFETDALTTAIQKLWTCSSPETVGPANHGIVVPSLRFLGVNIERDDHGTFGGGIVHQQEYILDMLSRFSEHLAVRLRATTGEPESYSETQKKVEKKIDHGPTAPSIHAKAIDHRVDIVGKHSYKTRHLLGSGTSIKPCD